jgi:hypothetical protein
VSQCERGAATATLAHLVLQELEGASKANVYCLMGADEHSNARSGVRVLR